MLTLIVAMGLGSDDREDNGAFFHSPRVSTHQAIMKEVTRVTVDETL